MAIAHKKSTSCPNYMQHTICMRKVFVCCEIWVIELSLFFIYLWKLGVLQNTCPTSIQEAKEIVCPLDLLHVKYHVCMNDCIIYRSETTERTTCTECGAAQYKKGKKAPRKVVATFQSLLVYSGISQTAGTRKGISHKMIRKMRRCSCM